MVVFLERFVIAVLVGIALAVMLTNPTHLPDTLRILVAVAAAAAALAIGSYIRKSQAQKAAPTSQPTTAPPPPAQPIGPVEPDFAPWHGEALRAIEPPQLQHLVAPRPAQIVDTAVTAVDFVDRAPSWERKARKTTKPFEAYIGKQIRVSGRIRSKRERLDGIRVELEPTEFEGEYRQFTLEFPGFQIKLRKKFRHGDLITAVGRIAQANAKYFTLDPCVFESSQGSG